MSEVKTHKRVHNMLLGSIEKPLLQWFCTWMPLWVNSDILTGLGILGSVLIFLGYCLTQSNSSFLWLASFGFFINWFGDSLDGTIARYRKTERPKYGFFVDHTIDSFSAVLIFSGVALSPYVRLEIAALACVGYLLMMILVLVNTIVSDEFKISYARIGPTEIRVIAILINTIVFFLGNLNIRLLFISISLFDLFIAIIGMFLFTTFIVLGFKEAGKWKKFDLKRHSEGKT